MSDYLRSEMVRDLHKCRKVVDSCYNLDQFKVAERYFELYMRSAKAKARAGLLSRWFYREATKLRAKKLAALLAKNPK